MQALFPNLLHGCSIPLETEEGSEGGREGGRKGRREGKEERRGWREIGELKQNYSSLDTGPGRKCTQMRV